MTMSELKSYVNKIGMSFWIVVIIPFLIACLYYGVFASDVYVSQSRFVVRNPDKPASSGIGIILKTAGFSGAGDEISAAQNYILSRDALRNLNKDGKFSRAFSGENIYILDRFNPMGMDNSFENLFNYYQKKVAIDNTTSTSITELTVRAYSAKDAQQINENLLQQTEHLVNRLNARSQRDLVQFAEAEVTEAQTAASRAAEALAQYRNRAGVIDPERQAAIQLQMISKLQDELIGAEQQLLQLRSIARNNPQIPLLQTRIDGLKRAIDAQSGRVAGDRQSLSASAVQYQRFQLEREFADRRLAAALVSLQDARNEARRKQAYVERIVQPNLPDEPIEPRRFRGVLSVLIIGLVVWGILSMLIAGIREHND